MSNIDNISAESGDLEDAANDPMNMLKGFLNLSTAGSIISFISDINSYESTKAYRADVKAQLKKIENQLKTISKKISTVETEITSLSVQNNANHYQVNESTINNAFSNLIGVLPSAVSSSTSINKGVINESLANLVSACKQAVLGANNVNNCSTQINWLVTGMSDSTVLDDISSTNQGAILNYENKAKITASGVEAFEYYDYITNVVLSVIKSYIKSVICILISESVSNYVQSNKSLANDINYAFNYGTGATELSNINTLIKDMNSWISKNVPSWVSSLVTTYNNNMAATPVKSTSVTIASYGTFLNISSNGLLEFDGSTGSDWIIESAPKDSSASTKAKAFHLKTIWNGKTCYLNTDFISGFAVGQDGGVISESKYATSFMFYLWSSGGNPQGGIAYINASKEISSIYAGGGTSILLDPVISNPDIEPDAVLTITVAD